MTDYINRKAALLSMTPIVKRASERNRNILSAVEQCVEAINRCPAADVVPVVRCGECKWFQINMRQDGYLPEGVPECECRHWCGACDPTDFCSYGVRKDGDGDV